MNKDEKFHRGIIDIHEEEFSKVIEEFEKRGYRNKDYDIGSLGLKGHITSINSPELTKNYDEVVLQHKKYTNESNQIKLMPLDIKKGKPSAGKISEVVIVTMGIDQFDEYRGVLGPTKYPPHLSIFSKEIQPIKKLEKIGFFEFTNEKNNEYLIKLNGYLLKSNLFNSEN